MNPRPEIRPTPKGRYVCDVVVRGFFLRAFGDSAEEAYQRWLDALIDLYLKRSAR